MVYILKKGAKHKRSKREIEQNEADYYAFQRELSATKENNEEKVKSQHPLLTHRDL